MRIRKNANVSDFILSEMSSYSTTIIKLEPHFCTLNQSPWDVLSITTSKQNRPIRQLPTSSLRPPMSSNKGYLHTGRHLIKDNNGKGFSDVKESSAIYISPEWEERGEVKGAVNDIGRKQNDYGNTLTDGIKSDKPIVLCCNTDKKSRCCKNHAVEDSALCGNHLTLARNHNNHSKKSIGVVAAEPKTMTEKHHPRSKKAGSSKLRDFYYYSDFGPFWGKKRGVYKENDGIGTATRDVPKVERTSSSSQTNNDIAYTDEDEEKEELYNKRKRARKHVKARSLKSFTM